MRALLVLLCVLTAAITAGQDIQLHGPAVPVEPREYVQIMVQDLTDADITAASIDWTPRAETTLIPARLWGGQPFLLFSARRPGRYEIVVTVHAWRNDLDAAVDATRRAAVIDQALFQRLESLAADLRTRYPVRTGRCTVEVAGVVPTPPDPPAPPGPDPPPQSADQVTIVTESQEPLSAEQLEIVHGENVRSAATAAGLEFHVLDVNASGPDLERVKHALDACRGQSLPRIVFSAQRKVTDNRPLPASVADAVGLIQSRGKQR